MIRESSCPLCQRSWNATGRSCSFAYSVLRMAASTCVPGVSTNQRRAMIRPASSTPSTRTMIAAGQIWAPSPVDSGPSTRLCSTSGMPSDTMAARSAATMPSTIRGRAGRMNG